MILALSIRDFVLIDRLDIEPGSGFTALTGETGAGKSIILDALALTLGVAGRPGPHPLRRGAGERCGGVCCCAGPSGFGTCCQSMASRRAPTRR